jgi:hypothetical protein
MSDKSVEWVDFDDVAASVERAVAQGLPLGLSRVDGRRQATLERLLEHPRLTDLTVMEAHELDLGPIARMRWLRKLNLQGGAVGFDLSRLDQLESLNCTWSPRAQLPPAEGRLEGLGLGGFAPRDRSLITLPDWKRLERVSFVQPRVDTLAGIARWSSLKYLTVYGARSLTSIGDLAACPSLHTVLWESTPVPLDFPALAASSTLRTLTCFRCRSIPSVAFAARMPNLERFVLLRTKVEDGDLKPLSRIREVVVE